MDNYIKNVNAGYFFLLVAAVLLFVTAACVVFLVKSYKTGIRLGMDKKILNKTILSSATFTLLPSVSILLGVVALSGSLGVPFSWLRLSVIGALQYELNVAEIAAQSTGLSGLKVAELDMSSFVTIALVMTVGILSGVVCSIFFLKKYLGKINKRKDEEKNTDAKYTDEKNTDAKNTDAKNSDKKGDFAAIASASMFVGLCASYIGSYIGLVFKPDNPDCLPLMVAGVAAVIMGIFEFFIQKKKILVLENFSLAVSMLIAMISAVFINQII